MIPELRLDEEFSVGIGEKADKQVQTISTYFAEGKNENKDRLLKKRQVFLFKKKSIQTDARNLCEIPTSCIAI